LHKINPNLIILNSIKEKYELIKKNKIFNCNYIDNKIKKINDIIKSTNVSDLNDNIYFETKLEGKELFNTFLFLSQKLHFNKSNETPYSKIFLLMNY